MKKQLARNRVKDDYRSVAAELCPSAFSVVSEDYNALHLLDGTLFLENFMRKQLIK